MGEESRRRTVFGEMGTVVDIGGLLAVRRADQPSRCFSLTSSSTSPMFILANCEMIEPWKPDSTPTTSSITFATSFCVVSPSSTRVKTAARTLSSFLAAPGTSLTRSFDLSVVGRSSPALATTSAAPASSAQAAMATAAEEKSLL